MESKHYSSFTNIGLVSLMTVFIVLCLIIFSVLTLSEGLRDMRLSQKLANHTSEYYAASNEAQSVLARLDEELETAAGESEAAFYNQLIVFLNENELSYNDETQTVFYQIPMNGNQALDVALHITYSESTQTAACEITSWKEVQTAEWKADNSVKVIQ